jgi:hypothetical protein
MTNSTSANFLPRKPLLSIYELWDVIWKLPDPYALTNNTLSSL